MKKKLITGESIEIDPASERLISFVLANGGYSEVAKAIGKSSPQLFYNIRNGINKPSLDTLRELKERFGERFDLTYIITGQRSAQTADYVQKRVDEIQQEVRQTVEAQFAEKLKEKDKLIDAINRDKERMWSVIDALKKLEGFSLPPFTSFRSEFGIG